MSETRNSNPYISHLIVTQRTTMIQVPTDYQDQQGNRLFQNVDCPPGIACEITPYVTPTIKAPAQNYVFPLRALYELGIEQLEAKENKTEQEVAALNRLKEYVASPDMVWTEDIMEEAGITDFKNMWSESFSDVLDVFTEWREPTTSSPGVPNKVLPMQWECRVPYEAAKSVNVNVGVYATKDGVANENIRPTQHVLSFEDNATKTARLKRISDMTTKISELTSQLAGLTAEIEALPEGPTKVAKVAEKERVEADKTNWVNQLTQIQAVANGLISQLIALPSIQQSLPALSLSILMKVSEKEGWGLDKAETATKLTQTLGLLAQA